mmetsp:Transcript_2038/g.4697  ORF Transcript_2038/g.4697 Transcript_2038/m.4697 type:complete len:92 (+) Transcript_2038:171-446(+)
MERSREWQRSILILYQYNDSDLIMLRRITASNHWLTTSSPSSDMLWSLEMPMLICLDWWYTSTAGLRCRCATPLIGFQLFFVISLHRLPPD